MELLKAIQTRRSIRKFTDEPVDDNLVEEIIRAGMMAPSAGNEKPWHFVVIRDAKLLKAISAEHLYASVVEKAPVAVLLCGDQRAEKYGDFWDQDCAAATQNMLLVAHSLGLGSVWLGIHPRVQRVSDIRGLITLPAHIVPFSLLPLGYPDEEKGSESRFNRGRIHYEQW